MLELPRNPPACATAYRVGMHHSPSLSKPIKLTVAGLTLTSKTPKLTSMIKVAIAMATKPKNTLRPLIFKSKEIDFFFDHLSKNKKSPHFD
jgi:hypothetical protein